MSYQFSSDGHQLVGRLARPERIPIGGVPGLVICHGFPAQPSNRLDAGRSYYELAERIAMDVGWVSLAFTYRGCGESEGNFSVAGWLADIVHAAQHVGELEDVNGVYVAGFGTGGALAIVAAADHDEIRGVAAVSPPADFHDWHGDPDGLMDYARSVGAISDPDFPTDVEAWQRELAEIKPVDAAGRMGDRPLLLLHGADDAVIPVFDARVLADAHGTADLRVINGAGHRLRFDPRAVAVLIGWLTRVQRLSTQGSDPGV